MYLLIWQTMIIIPLAIYYNNRPRWLRTSFKDSSITQIKLAQVFSYIKTKQPRYIKCYDQMKIWNPNRHTAMPAVDSKNFYNYDQVTIKTSFNSLGLWLAAGDSYVWLHNSRQLTIHFDFMTSTKPDFLASYNFFQLARAFCLAT